MEASIQEVARLTGTTSRTLRHYDQIGLLEPSRVGENGYRWYDEDALVRLQRILLLRDLGLGLTEIGRVLDRETDETAALRRHLDWLRSEQQRLGRQAASVVRTLTARQEGAPIMADQMFDGFDHTQYQDEVEQRWGKDAYAQSDAWWRGMSDAERTAFQERSATLARDWASAAEAGVDPVSDEAQELARRHVAWLGGIPGTPGAGSTPVREYVVGLADMYVADPRFAKNYGGEPGATFVRDALHEYAARHL
ncbi:MerR family transcriptional regulator [Cellulomonas fimi]|uniref:Transcriptional regulator, MerR family n=1 Tax=Cellulomonas fimi (strain ATCC 484 / DSM 20113 / JCM 1341 / CCUG 24087 / LMG 16345 / NBRC 15513 / NCIMB 8980 / NCTC 7547 / NRS-133) TaxID=590998 RepID=F4H6H4_CELFA|nr:MerR family transcriptional regulator [Cellulomonas fimi]AEE45607.1 transcriptional regulator, MerR family [Cellulomonas fimi ATCC 484]NNH05885.1 MerR family transcriptional regulator [Cellulomonas fimi]VEH30047.1 HTH-type transcriptional activator tipA [Cellulomonas fimi]